MPTKRISALFNPEQYHGWGRKKRFFEGWYYKIVSENQLHALAIIPGIAMDATGKQHAFIQVFDGKKSRADYHTFAMADFCPKPHDFDVEIGENRFNKTTLSLNLPDLKGELRFDDHVHWPSSWYSPNIMGPFSFFPFLECYHGVVSMDHTIHGELELDGVRLDFNGGKGYLEKDWGHSFPSAHIWMQSNHFSRPDVSLNVSIAKTTVLKSKFVGFIAGLWVGQEVIRFTTYNFSTLKKSVPGEDLVEIVLENKRHRLEIVAHRGSTTALIAPIGGLMSGRVEECMTAKIHMKLIEKRTGDTLLEDIGTSGAIEVAGNIQGLTIP